MTGGGQRGIPALLNSRDTPDGRPETNSVHRCLTHQPPPWSVRLQGSRAGLGVHSAYNQAWGWEGHWSEAQCPPPTQSAPCTGWGKLQICPRRVDRCPGSFRGKGHISAVFGLSESQVPHRKQEVSGTHLPLGFGFHELRKAGGDSTGCQVTVASHWRDRFSEE